MGDWRSDDQILAGRIRLLSSASYSARQFGPAIAEDCQPSEHWQVGCRPHLYLEQSRAVLMYETGSAFCGICRAW